MAKIPFQDVVPPNKRSIRNISINSARRSRTQVEPPKQKEEPQIIELHKMGVPPPEPETDQGPESFGNSIKFNGGVGGINDFIKETTKSTPTLNSQKQNYYYEENNNKKKGKRTLIFVATGVVIIGFVAFIMTVLSSATVTLTPKRQDFQANLDLKISKDGAEDIKYELVKLTKSNSVSVTAKGEEMVEKKASGKIIVYNNFSEDPQRLISRTRFETPSGLIYRIPDSITIPGRKVENGTTVPGSIEVEVFADEAGEKYNTGKVDFTIPGFKNDKERYSSFYARSVDEISGGFIGKMKTVVEADKVSALSKLESDIKTSIEKEVQAQVPDGLVMLSGGTFYTTKELPQKDESSSVSLTLEVSAYSILLPKDLLSQKVVESVTGPEWQNISSRVADFSPLTISTKTVDPINSDNLDVKIAGNTTVEANIDQNVISESLAGTSKKNMSTVLSGFPGILEAQAAIRPIWKKDFPANPAKIYINIK